MIFFIFLQGAAVAVEKAGPVDFTLEPILSSEWVCYLQDGDLYIRNINAGAVKVRGGKEANAAILGPSLVVKGSSAFVAWVERGTGGNKTLFRASRDNGKTLGEVLELSIRTRTPQVLLLMDTKGRIYAVDSVAGKDPEISLHLSEDKGKTFKRIPVRTEGMEFLSNPAPVVTDDALYLFHYGGRDGRKFIGAKSFEIPSMKPKGDDVLKEADGASFVEAFAIRDTPAVIYKTSREGKFVLEGFRKKDTGWDAFEIKEAEGLDVARMDYHVWEDGRMLLLFSGEEKGKYKQRVFAGASNDLGEHWEVTRIDTREFDNTRSWLPRMAVDGDRVVVVWEDSRDIRPVIRMRISQDRGRTWKAKDFPVSADRCYAFRPRISFAKGAFIIAWEQFRDDERKAADLVMKKVKWDEAMKMAFKKEKNISLKKKEELLRKRAEAYWKGMMKKDMKTTYAIHDPFYRARIPFESYAGQRGPMVYHGYAIEGVRIEGNEAFVKIKVIYEVPKITLLGRETSIPRKEVSAEDTYLFIGGTWYRKFVDALSGGSAIDY